jgi:hypothetical protein
MDKTLYATTWVVGMGRFLNSRRMEDTFFTAVASLEIEPIVNKLGTCFARNSAKSETYLT